MTDAVERVGDDERLDVELSRILDVAVETAATQRVAEGRATIARPFLYGDGVRVGDVLSHALDPRPHALAGNRAQDEHDLPVDAGDHPPTGRRLLDGQRQCLPGGDH